MSCANNELGILARRKIEAEIIKTDLPDPGA